MKNKITVLLLMIHLNTSCSIFNKSNASSQATTRESIKIDFSLYRPKGMLEEHLKNNLIPSIEILFEDTSKKMIPVVLNVASKDIQDSVPPSKNALRLNGEIVVRTSFEPLLWPSNAMEHPYISILIGKSRYVCHKLGNRAKNTGEMLKAVRLVLSSDLGLGKCEIFTRYDKKN